MTIDQWIILCTGVPAVFLSQSRDGLKPFASIFGLLGQPAWIYFAWHGGSWGVLIITLLYTAAWTKGFVIYWILAGDQTCKARFRHLKRGSFYRREGEFTLQCYQHDGPSLDGARCVLYRAESDGSLWGRPRDMFYDGRFEAVNAKGDPIIVGHSMGSHR